MNDEIAAEASLATVSQEVNVNRKTSGSEFLRAATRIRETSYTESLSPDDMSPLSPSPAMVYEEFPTHALPGPMLEFVVQAAASLDVDEAMIAVPALVACAGCLGAKRCVKLKADWIEPSVLWGVLIVRSGGLKTPAIDLVFEPLYEREQAEIEREKREWAEYNAARDGGEKGVAQPIPASRLLANDITVEAIAPLLQKSGSLIVIRDEWSGWFRALNQYKGQGADLQAYLEMHRAGPIIVDRKTSPTIAVRRAPVSICGGVQPGVLREALTNEHMEAGLAARFLFAMPPERQRRWSDDELGREAKQNWAQLLYGLLDLPAGMPGASHPPGLPLSEAAQECFIEFHNRSTDQERAEVEYERVANAAAISKSIGTAARFALIYELVEDRLAKEIGLEAMESSIELAEWFRRESARVHGRLAETEELRIQRELCEWIRAHGGRCTVRELMRGPRKFRKDRRTALSALWGLIEDGLGEWRAVTTHHRTRVFVLHTGGDGDGGDGE